MSEYTTPVPPVPPGALKPDDQNEVEPQEAGWDVGQVAKVAATVVIMLGSFVAAYLGIQDAMKAGMFAVLIMWVIGMMS